MVFGYVRVSTKEQKEARQLDALSGFNISPRNLFMDKQSGKDFDRPAWRRLMRRIRPGDVLVVESIDRLGRNYSDILEQWRLLTREKRVDIVVLDMPLLDTRAKDRDLTGRFISGLVLQILCYVAQTEREMLKKRQAEGIAAAQARGVHCGRPQSPLPPDFEAVRALCARNEISLREGARQLNLSASTFRRMLKRV